MINVYNTVLTMKQNLSANTNFSDLRFILDYPSEKQPVPMTRPHIILGVEDLKEEKGAVYDKSDPPVLLYNRETTAKICFDINVPYSFGGIQCYLIFYRIVDPIFEANGNSKYVSAGHGEVKYNRETGTFCLPAYIEYKEQRTI